MLSVFTLTYPASRPKISGGVANLIFPAIGGRREGASPPAGVSCMKADHRKHLEQNELASRLTRWWKGGGESTTPASTWAIIGALVLAAALVGIWFYFKSANSQSRANVWKQIEETTKPEDLEKIIEANRGTGPGRAAKAQLARMLLTEGITKLASRLDRSKAIGDIDRARTLYTELAKESKDDPLLQREALLASAKAEESLVGIPKPDSPTEMYGSLDRALEVYDECAGKFGDTPQGKEAADRAKDIRENKAKIEEFYVNMNKRLSEAPSRKDPSSFAPDF